MPSLDPASTWLRLPEIVALGVAPRTLRRRIAEGQFVARGPKPSKEVLLASLPAELRIKYLRLCGELADAERPGADLDAGERDRRLARFQHRPEVLVAMANEAKRRADLLDLFDAISPKTVDENGERVPAPEVRALQQRWITTDALVLGVEPSWSKPPSLRALFRALDAYRAGGAFALIPASSGGRPKDARIAPHVRDVLLRLRFDESPHAPAVAIYRRLREELPGEELPSERTIRRFLNAIPQHVSVYERRGVRTYRGTMARPIHRDIASVDVGEWLVGDHHQLDVPVINPRAKGKLARPWLTMWLDVRASAPVGWVISCDDPNAERVAEAFTNAVRPKAHPAFKNLCGVPDVAYIDNGKDYRSASVEVLFKQLGVESHHALPYNAKAKVVERFFRTLCTQFSMTFPTWCGNSPTERTERFRELVKQHDRWMKGDEKETPFITLDEMKRRFADWVVTYLQQPHDGLKEIDTGRERSPAAVAADRRRPPRLVKDELTLAIIAWPREDRIVRKGEVNIAGLYYQAPELLPLHGRRVVCHLDPADATRILVTLDGRLVGEAKTPQLARYAKNGDAVAWAHIAEQNRIRRDEERKLREAREIRIRRWEDEIAPPPAPAAPEPETAASPAAELPADAIVQVVPSVSELVRAARSRGRTAPAPAAAPAESDDAAVQRAIGDRPTLPEFYTDFERARWEREAAAWDEQRDGILRFLAEKRAKQGGPR